MTSRGATSIDRLLRLLDRLEDTIDVHRADAIDALHRSALSYEPLDRLPVAMACLEPLPEELHPWPISEAVRDPAKMMFNELVSAWDTSIVRREAIGDDLPATIRANFGTCLVASCFGGTIDQPENTPAWVRQFQTDEEFDRAIAREPDLSSSWVDRATQTMQFYHETLRSYPGLRSVLRLTIPDLQGPLDNAAMLRGSAIFLDVLTDSARFRAALEAMADAQVMLRREFAKLAADGPDGFIHQHGVLVPGNLLIRNDSSVMVSPEMYRDQIGPYDEQVLAAVGGGAIHSCGRIDHVVAGYLEHPSIRAIDFGQSWMNDVDAAYRCASASGIALLRVRVERDELETGTILERFPSGVILIHVAEGVSEARETMERYRDAADERARRGPR